MPSSKHPDAAARPILYTVHASAPHSHIIEVSCRVLTPNATGQLFQLPTWTPGSYLIREFAKNILRIWASTDRGPSSLSKISKDTWRVEPTEGVLTVTTQIYSYDVSVRTAYLGDDRLFFNGASIFLRALGFEDSECTLLITRPSSRQWSDRKVATTLTAAEIDADAFGLYTASNYEELIDHPVEVASFARTAFKSSGVAHEIVISGRHDADLTRLSQDLSSICRYHIDFFHGPDGRPPFDRYLFQIMAVGEGYGGLEHRSSTSLLCRRDELPAPGVTQVTDDYLTLLGLASHEYFHAWNVKRIKPASFTPYDLGREAYTRQLWAFEGVTSYYDDLALVRSQIITPERYLALVGRTITSVLRTPGRKVQSVAESSFDAWIKFYRPDENTPNAVVSYYALGSLVAMALDLLLRAEGRGSLDDVMRMLWRQHGATQVGVPEDGFERAAESIAGHDLQAFFRSHVHGTDDLPLSDLLGSVGVAFRVRPAQNAADRGGKPAAGELPAVSLNVRVGPDMRLINVYSDGAAERAGLAPGDQIVAVNGIKATPESLRLVLERRSPGDSIEVHAFRRDELYVVAATLDAAPLDTCYLEIDAAATAEAVTRRIAWLGA
ncbi:MAG: PDZ domain-containing protein [Casimicrobiaceae bacterium]